MQFSDSAYYKKIIYQISKASNERKAQLNYGTIKGLNQRKS